MDRTQEARLPPLHPDQRVLGGVERFFGILTQKQRCLYIGAAFGEGLREYLESYNENPRALVWTKSVEEILEDPWTSGYPKQLKLFC